MPIELSSDERLLWEGSTVKAPGFSAVDVVLLGYALLFACSGALVYLSPAPPWLKWVVLAYTGLLVVRALHAVVTRRSRSNRYRITSRRLIVERPRRRSRSYFLISLTATEVTGSTVRFNGLRTFTEAGEAMGTRRIRTVTGAIRTLVPPLYGLLDADRVPAIVDDALDEIARQLVKSRTAKPEAPGRS
ncbi:hypothetical protein [Actinokineospora terrae]|uniref:hypothetical protein n=1 Tax=Actinokineospora terrae TaxID=155974 RepID=UPI00116027BE|nr:hypothetical protein [Actinokineospora terrae]